MRVMRLEIELSRSDIADALRQYVSRCGYPTTDGEVRFELRSNELELLAFVSVANAANKPTDEGER